MQENTHNNENKIEPTPDNQQSQNNPVPISVEIQPQASTISATPPPPQIKIGENKRNPFPFYLLSLIMLIVGIALGLFLVKEFPQFNTPTKVAYTTTANPNQKVNLDIPKDAVQIETCEDNKGSLFVKPQDIPQGPIYMSYKGKVIGLEFMLNANQIMSNGKFDFLSGEDIKVDHIKFGYLSEGHEGNPTPHFHADLYTVSRSLEQAIKCPPGQSQQMNMPGMDMGTGSNSADMNPAPSSKEMIMQPANTTPMLTNIPNSQYK